MKTRQQVLTNTLSGWFVMGTRAVLALVLVPFLLREMGREAYGLLGLAGAVMSLSFVTDLGLRSALSREMAEKIALGDPHAVNRLASTALGLYLALGTLVAALLVVAAPYLLNALNVPPALFGRALLLFRVYGGCMLLLAFVKPVFTSVIAAHNRYDLVNLPEAACGAAACLLLLVVIRLTAHRIFAWAAIMLGCQGLLLLLILAVTARRLSPSLNLSLSPACFDRASLRELFRLGSSMYLLQLTTAFAERTDPFVISAFMGPAGVSLYKPGSQLSEMLRPAVLTLSNQLQPLATQRFTHRLTRDVQRILVLGTRYTLLLGLPATLLLLAAAHPFCRLWLRPSLGADYAIAATVMQGWALADLFTYAGGSQWAVLLAMKRLRFVVWTQLPAAVLNLAVSVYLVGFTSLGVPGVLVATILVSAVRRPVLAAFTAAACGTTATAYFREAYLRPLAAGLPTALLVLAGNRLLDLETWPALLGYLAVLGVTALAAAAFIGLRADERRGLFAAAAALLTQRGRTG